MTAQTTMTAKQEAKQSNEVERTRSRRVFAARTDIYERDDALVVLAEMPGVTQDTIDVTLEGNQLAIVGRVDAQPVEGHELSYAEYEIGDYERRFRVPDGLNADEIDAVLENGVLRLVLRKAEEKKPKKIVIKEN